MYKLAAIALAGSLLVGCATTGAVDPALCPPVKQYTKQEQKEFLEAGERSPKVIRDKLIPHYLDLRDAAIKCRTAR